MKYIASVAGFLVSGLVLSVGLQAQSLYKSIGPDGRVVYSDRPPSEGRLDKVMKFANLPSSNLPASASSQLEQLRKQKANQQSAVQDDRVVMYTTSWCGYCKKAKAYLASKRISYQEFDIETQQGMAAYAQAGGSGGVPLLLYRSERVQGYSTDAYDALFKRHR